ncbi:MAG: glycosyltransferase [Deinococcus sp.]|nr:glycosyltransferase [Deinococcus sp.]
MQDKLTIAIPVFNFDASQLIEALCSEIEEARLNEAIELVIIDDGSTELTPKNANIKALERYPRIVSKHIEFEHNFGRAQARNMGIEQGEGGYLLFLDADMLPDSSQFLRNYLQVIWRGGWDVVCGGISYRQIGEVKGPYRLYQYLSASTDVVPATKRNVLPWKHILTSNVLVKWTVANEVPFDDRFNTWGYEDLDWGIRLVTGGYKVLHIDNTCTHLGLVPKDVLLARTKASVKNYTLLASKHPAFFKETRIFGATRFLGYLSPRVLGFLSRMISRVLNSRGLGYKVQYVVLQFGKAVWLTSELKTQGLVGRPRCER